MWAEKVVLLLAGGVGEPLARRVLGGALAALVAWTPAPAATEQPAPEPVSITANLSKNVATPKKPKVGILDFESSDSITVLVNKSQPLNPVTYAPADLKVVGSVELRAEAATHLADLLAAAKANGTPLRTQSGYRSYAAQKGTFAKWVAQYGSKHAEMYSAKPGYSEHQTGLTVDLIPATGACQKLSRCVAQTPAGKWLLANAADYGFILRYEQDTTDITGYGYEPWHFRFVGLPVAADYVTGDFHTYEEYVVSRMAELG